MQAYRMRGVHAVKSKGRVYYYYRPTGERLPDDEHARAIRVAELSRPSSGKMKDLIAEYRKSRAYAKLAPSTQDDYERWLRWLEDGKRGDASVGTATPESIALLCAQFEERPRAHDKLLGVLSVLFAFARRKPSVYNLRINPAQDIPRLHEGEGYLPWSEELYQQAMDAAYPELRDALFLGRQTGQGINEVVSMTVFHWTGDALDFRRQKSGKRIFIPASPDMMRFMEDRKEGHLLRTKTGKPWRRNWLQREVAALTDGLGFAGHTFHGIRKLTVTDMRESGLEREDIADLIGMSPQMVDHYSRGYDQERRARATLVKMEQVRKARRGEL